MTQPPIAGFNLMVLRADIAANVRAERARAALNQPDVAERMRDLGFRSWLSQTVSSVERARRRVTAEEICGLAAALGTSVAALMPRR